MHAMQVNPALLAASSRATCPIISNGKDMSAGIKLIRSLEVLGGVIEVIYRQGATNYGFNFHDGVTQNFVINTHELLEILQKNAADSMQKREHLVNRGRSPSQRKSISPEIRKVDYATLQDLVNNLNSLVGRSRAKGRFNFQLDQNHLIVSGHYGLKAIGKILYLLSSTPQKISILDRKCGQQLVDAMRKHCTHYLQTHHLATTRENINDIVNISAESGENAITLFRTAPIQGEKTLANWVSSLDETDMVFLGLVFGNRVCQREKVFQPLLKQQCPFSRHAA